MTLRDALASAMAAEQGDFVGKESVWTYRAGRVLSDPTFRAALVRAVAEALRRVMWGLDDDEVAEPSRDDCDTAAAIVTRMLPSGSQSATGGEADR